MPLVEVVYISPKCIPV